MNKIFKKSRSISPSFEIPKICLPHQKKSIDHTTTSSHSDDQSQCLHVPNELRMRSSSFDASSLHFQSDQLNVPKQGRRCHSFDSSCSIQLSPGSSDENVSDRKTGCNSKLSKYSRLNTSLDIPKLCIHCVHTEAKAKELEAELNIFCNIYNKNTGTYSDDVSLNSSTSYTSSSSESLSTDQTHFYYLSDGDDKGNESCNPERDEECVTNDRQKLTSPSFSCHSRSSATSFQRQISIELETDSRESEKSAIDKGTDVYTNVLTLEVPIIKQYRSSSLDACYLKVPDVGKGAGSSIRRQASFEIDVVDAPIQVRSSSVDVTLPTEQDARYKAILNSSASLTPSK
ncbi:hypothetical protein CHS0354_033643 [Potamilus streckersoni]|uniref:Uncharacterized protein n=1 Tax=Potamilus streckersoni TaxID=2493646 RepID=A0AAE0S243_9BIVA|nr:hypothetical protein CHS0354_033643 [Potamilus streckersoni]